MKEIVAQSNRLSPAKVRRKGVPHTVYFSRELSAALDAEAKNRCVGKSTIVRVAVEQFLEKLQGGQLNLQLGISKR